MPDSESRQDSAVAQFWDRYLEQLRSQGVKLDAERWHVRRAEHTEPGVECTGLSIRPGAKEARISSDDVVPTQAGIQQHIDCSVPDSGSLLRYACPRLRSGGPE